MANSTKQQYSIGIFWCLVTYVAAFAAAAATIYLLPSHWHMALSTGLAVVIATLVIFIFSMAFNNSSFYDAYWSITPIVIAFYWYANSTGQINETRAFIVHGLVIAWGIRLTYNWLRGWQGLKHEDWRYLDLKLKHGKNYWLVSLAGIHLFPTVLTFLGSWPLYAVFVSNNRPFNWLDIVAAVITFVAILIEATADRQLHNFKKTNTDPQKILDTGLWRYSRHPNYFGEILFWWGLYLFGIAANVSFWKIFISPLAITLLFAFISIKLIDTRMLAKRPHYAERIKKVSAIVPWFR